jgi:hypothetical protein
MSTAGGEVVGDAVAVGPRGGAVHAHRQGRGHRSGKDQEAADDPPVMNGDAARWRRSGGPVGSPNGSYGPAWCGALILISPRLWTAARAWPARS